MTDRTWRAGLVCVGLAASLAGCPRRHPAPDGTVRGTPPSDDVQDVTVREPVDAGTAPVGGMSDAAGVTVRDVPRPMPAVRAGAWRQSPRVHLEGARVLATWEEAPDLDGDEVPDPLAAVVWDPVVTRCTQTSDDRPCPALDADDSGGNAGDGPLLVAVVARLSSDAQDGDAGMVGRLVGLRRLWQATRDVPSTRVTGFEFAEFGPGVLVRATLTTTGSHADDTLDVVDLYTGVGLERRAGSILQHCTHEPGHTPVRAGTLAVTLGSLAPLVWRAAQAHPFSGCATDAVALDALLGETMARGAVARVTATAPAGQAAHVGIGYGAAGFHLAGPDDPDPLAVGERRVQDITRGCTADRVRYTEGTRHCVLQVPRDDGSMPGCEDHPSPLDPRPPRAVALVGGDDGGVVRLVFSRGGTPLSVPLPARCGHGGQRVEASPWTGDLPAGLGVSPTGHRVLMPAGMDLWLFMPGRRGPVLLNPPGGALPRGTVRAVAFADPGRAAAVISEDLVQFDVNVTDDDGGPADVRIDPGEITRTLRGM